MQRLLSFEFLFGGKCKKIMKSVVEYTEACHSLNKRKRICLCSSLLNVLFFDWTEYTEKETE